MDPQIIENYRKNHPEPMRYIDTSNVVWLQNVVLRSAQKILKKIREVYHLPRGHKLPIEKYCEYYGIRPDDAEYYLWKKKQPKIKWY